MFSSEICLFTSRLFGSKAAISFVNIRDKKQIGVVELKERRLITTWTAPDL
jgi:hypothetical protein